MEERLSEAVPYPGPHRTPRDGRQRTRLDAAERALPIPIGGDIFIITGTHHGVRPAAGAGTLMNRKTPDPRRSR